MFTALDRPNLTTERLAKYRALAALEWSKASKSTFQSQQVAQNEHLPGFFVDRYAFRLWISDQLGTPRPSIPEFDWLAALQKREEELRQNICGLPEFQIPTPRLDEHVPIRPFLVDLSSKWISFLENQGLYDPAPHFDRLLSEQMTWRELFDNSIFYPRLPVIWGPTYFRRLAPIDQDFLLEKYGCKGVQDFYIFLYFTHETAHFHQTGEPLLNEFIHALTWTKFLKRYSLLRFQVNSISGYCCNKEYAYIADLDIPQRNLRNFFNDTEIGTNSFFGENSTYQSLIATAWLMDHRRIRYDDYLHVASTTFRKQEWNPTVLRQVLDRREEVGTEDVQLVERLALARSQKEQRKKAK